jgi:sporulation protein YqfC
MTYNEIISFPEPPMEKNTDSAIITIVGNSMTCIENFKSIVCYDNDVLKIKTKKGFVDIKGRNLDITYYDDEEILIKGCIISIDFADGSI